MREGLKEGAEQEVNPWRGGPFLLLESPLPFGELGLACPHQCGGKGARPKIMVCPMKGNRCEKAGFIPSLVFSGSVF